MKVNGSFSPSSSFEIKEDNGIASIIFYCDVKQETEEIDGVERTSWSWNEYHLERPYRSTLYDDIEANYSVWLQSAKECDEKRNTIDEYQLRADVDYLLITGGANAMLMTLSLNNESDPDVLDKASEYYPARWSEDRLKTLVSMQKLTASDFQSITGKPYETEVIG